MVGFLQLICCLVMLMENNGAQASPDRRIEGDLDIPVPNNRAAKGYNIGLRCLAIFINGYCLYWTLRNIIIFLILKKRYRDFTLILYYIFFVGLFMTRLVQACFQFTMLNDRAVKNAIVIADGFSICIGLV